VIDMPHRVVQAIRHVSFEDLGSFAAPLQEAGYAIDYIDAAEFDLGSLDPLRADILVVLGGPIGVYDHKAYPVMSLELELLRKRLASDRATLGICLGAQLMAAALGAEVYPGPRKEIGWSALHLTEAGEHGPLAVLRGVPVLHWHGDTFHLPEGCDLLASTDICRHQAFSRGSNILALQFHAELVATKLEHWLLGHACELAAANIDPFELRADAGRHAKMLEGRAQAMIRQWLSSLD
jgi:GMP synthase (glutamine-hydrolysing)